MRFIVRPGCRSGQSAVEFLVRPRVRAQGQVPTGAQAARQGNTRWFPGRPSAPANGGLPCSRKNMPCCRSSLRLPRPSRSALAKTPERMTYSLDAQASGVIETINNIANLTVVSKDGNDLKAEYRAGFVQGQLQAKGILSARDNTWNLSYLTDPAHAFPEAARPRAQRTGQGRAFAERQLRRPAPVYENPVHRPRRRAAAETAAVPDGRHLSWHNASATRRSGFLRKLASGCKLLQRKLNLIWGTRPRTLTFMDVYYVNAYNDLADILAHLQRKPDNRRPTPKNARPS